MDGLEKVYSAVSECYEGLSVVLNLLVSVWVGLPDLDVAHGEVAEAPDVGAESGELFVEGDAGDCRGGEPGAWDCRRRVDDVGGVGAVEFVPDPDVLAAGGDSTALVGVEVELGEGVVGVVAVGDGGVGVDVDPELVVVDGGLPAGGGLPEAGSQVDVVGADGVGVVVVGLGCC